MAESHYRSVAHTDNNQISPLMAAVEAGHLEMAERLLTAGADLEYLQHVNKMGGALHIAAHSGNIVMIELLLRHGADLLALNRNRFTPLHAAAAADQVAAMQVLISAGTSIDQGDYPPLRCCATSTAPGLPGFSFLIKAGADLDFKNELGWTLLHLLACVDRIPAMQMLLEAGANVNQRLPSGYTALNLAIEYYKPNTIFLLLKYDVDVLSINNENESVLDQALRKGLPQDVIKAIEIKIEQQKLLQAAEVQIDRQENCYNNGFFL